MKLPFDWRQLHDHQCMLRRDGWQLVAGVVELVEVCWQAKSATYMQFNAVLDIGATTKKTLLLR